MKRNSANQAILASASILALSSLAFSAQAQTSAEASRPDQSVATVDEIIVTGTRATGRTVANSASPIDVISGDAVVNTGAPNVLEALNLLLPSFNLPAQVQPDLGALVRGAQLRGLDPAYTLVLVNGKRRHTTAVARSRATSAPGQTQPSRWSATRSHPGGADPPSVPTLDGGS